MSPSMVVKNRMFSYIFLSWQILTLSILSAMEYRTSFLMQVIGMIINDLGFICIWIILFTSYPTINNWQLNDTILLYAIGTCSFGIVFVCCGGIMDLAKSITQGELDSFLTIPKSPLWQIALNKCHISAIGDLLFGISLIWFVQNLTGEKLLLFFMVSILSAMIMFNFTVIVQSIGFWVGNFEEGANRIFHMMLGFTLYPQSVFSGWLKVIMMTILPAFFITTLPVDIIRSFSWINIFYMFSFWLGTSFLALFIFKRGLRRYESGNLINVRM